MRKIICRGKRVDNREWITGAVTCFRNIAGKLYPAIIPVDDGEHFMTDCKAVYPDTIGEYIGECDRRETDICEDDILRWEGPDGENGRVLVKYRKGAFVFQCLENPNSAPTLYEDFEDAGQTLEVIGNVHDNPELLEG